VFRDIYDEGRWSDAFFNFDDLQDLPEDGELKDDLLRAAAKSFLRLHASCPASEDWLIADFKKRL
jgi:hypothetical protein